MNPEVDLYLETGCMRCELGGTPECKVHLWTDILKALRAIVLDCGLTEERKWGVPTYTFQRKNIVNIAAFKNFASLSFFKGALLQDTTGLLVKPGENSQSGRYMPFTTLSEVQQHQAEIKAYLFEAIEAEKQGLKIDFKAKNELKLPIELADKLEKLPELKAAFDALTPGRKRSYVLHISQAKQAATRENRVEKCIPKIFQGKGFNEY